MKILTILEPHPNQLLDLVYRGLVEQGHEVTDLIFSPVRNSSVQDGLTIIRDAYGNNVGKEQSDGMIHFQKPLGGLKKCHVWLCPNSTIYNNDPDAINRLDDFDLILVGAFPKKNSVPNIEPILRKASDRFFILDGGDDWYIKRANEFCSVYFKRELMNRRVPNLKEFVARRLGDRRGNSAPEIIKFWKEEVIGDIMRADLKKTIANVMGKLYYRNRNFKPMNLSVASHSFDKYRGEKEYDIFFITSSGSASRRYFADKVSEFAKKAGLKAFVGVTGSFYGGVPWNEYIEKMQQSKVAIAYPGNGFDTIRYWEIPYYGSVLASPRLPIVIENNFKDMESAIFFSDFSEFKKKIIEVIANGYWKDIAIRGQEHFQKFHTEKERAKKLLSAIEIV